MKRCLLIIFAILAANITLFFGYSHYTKTPNGAFRRYFVHSRLEGSVFYVLITDQESDRIYYNYWSL